jgi:FkbM family methyltransferase
MDGYKAAPILKAKSLKPDLIVHVGSHEGQEIEAYLELKPRKIIFIEADPKTFQTLEKNMQSYSDYETEILCINVLISSQDDKDIDFYRYTNNGESSSIFRATHLLRTTWSIINLDETGEILSLRTKTLKSLFDELNLSIGSNSLLILDIQGAELEALIGLDKDLTKFEFLEIEVSTQQIYEQAPLFQQIDGYLQNYNFQRLTEIPWHGDIVYQQIK